MSERQRYTAIAGVIGIVFAFAGIVLIVDRYEKQLSHINWALVAILAGFALAAVAVYQWNARPGGYELVDLVMKDGKADPYRHLLFVFGGLGAWAVVQVVLAKEWATLTPLLAMLLGFFVAKPTIDGVSAAWAARPPQSAPAIDQTLTVGR